MMTPRVLQRSLLGPTTLVLSRSDLVCLTLVLDRRIRPRPLLI